jgi:hypothetical protein
MRMRTGGALFDTATPIPANSLDNDVKLRRFGTGGAEAEAVPLPERSVEVKTALERGNLISTMSSKFHYCWAGTETVLERRGSGCSKLRGKTAHDKSRRRKTEGTIPDVADLRAAYAEFGAEVEDVSELSFLYSRERMALQKMMIKAVYTVSTPIVSHVSLILLFTLL